MPTLLVTGANRGLGLELCKQCLADGWTIHACCRSPSNASQLISLAEASKKDKTNKLFIHPLDVRNAQQLENLQAALKNKPVDVLFNNAGVHARGASEFGRCDDDAWEEAVQVNLLAPMKMMECFVDNVASSQMKIIANVSSKMGSMTDNSSGGSYAYRATKAALNAVTVSAAQDLKHRDILVMLLHPGWVRTDMGGPHGELSVEQAVTLLRKLIGTADLSDSGKFLDIDGTEIPW
ncbi:MAG: SDR family oxidoreductase [Thiotrichaceae bacterium]